MTEKDFKDNIKTYLNILEDKYNFVLAKEVYDRDISFFLYQNINSNRTIEVILTFPIVADIIVMKGIVNKETIFDGINSFSLFEYCSELTNGLINKDNFEKPNRNINPIIEEAFNRYISNIDINNKQELNKLSENEFSLFTESDIKKLNEHNIKQFTLFLKNLDLYLEILDKYLGDVLLGNKWIYPRTMRLFYKIKNIFK